MTEKEMLGNANKKLRPCPFCGGQAILFRISENTKQETYLDKMVEKLPEVDF